MDRVEPLMTIDEVAKFLGMSKNTVYRLVKEEGLPAIRLVNRFRFRRTEVEQWLIARNVEEEE